MCCILLLGTVVVASPGSDKNKQQAHEAAFALILSDELRELYELLPDSEAKANWENKYWAMKENTVYRLRVVQ